ncbi:espin-like [Panicum miliaceum]|uniref:Espin-like n=1 Tax=Panicum miliaceum TaxID=4540 RepID=A0A3L6Q0G9_PANMI|nr:espin-like [Panicum miliaceum]
MSAAAADAGGRDDSACSTPFVSAPSSPSRDRDAYLPHHAACFYSAPASPTRGGAKDFGAAAGLLDFDFDFSSRFPSPSAAAMSSADELFCNGQIRPVRLAAALLQPQQPHGGAAAGETGPGPGAAAEDGGAGPDERGRVRGRSVRRKARSMSPFRTHWRRSPAPAPEVDPAADAEEQAAAVTPAASRSSSSSSTASPASSASSSSSSRGSRRWGGFLKDLLHRSKSDAGKTQHHDHSPLPAGPAPPTSPPPAAAPKRSPSLAATRTSGHRGGRRRSAHERLYEARRAEAEEMRRRTNLPYRQGFLLFGCIGLGHRSYGAVHGLARGLNAAAAVSSRS